MKEGAVATSRKIAWVRPPLRQTWFPAPVSVCVGGHGGGGGGHPIRQMTYECSNESDSEAIDNVKRQKYVQEGVAAALGYSGRGKTRPLPNTSDAILLLVIVAADMVAAWVTHRCFPRHMEA